MTHSSPSSTADVLRLARSDPEFGSEKPWHQRVSPRRILGRNSCFCSSVPHCRIVGPTSVSPKKSARIGARPWRTPRRAPRPAASTALCRRTPRPRGADPPPANSLAGHSSLNALRSSSVMLQRLAPLGRIDPAGGQVVGEPLADLGPEVLGRLRRTSTPWGQSARTSPIGDNGARTVSTAPCGCIRRSPATGRRLPLLCVDDRDGARRRRQPPAGRRSGRNCSRRSSRPASARDAPDAS